MEQADLLGDLDAGRAHEVRMGGPKDTANAAEPRHQRVGR